MFEAVDAKTYRGYWVFTIDTKRFEAILWMSLADSEVGELVAVFQDCGEV